MAILLIVWAYFSGFQKEGLDSRSGCHTFLLLRVDKIITYFINLVCGVVVTGLFVYLFA